MNMKILTLAAAALMSCAVSTSAQENRNLIMVSGPLIDPFFSAMKKGADDAAGDLSVTLQYTTITNFDNVQADLVQLLRVAASRKPDALLVANFFPDAMSPVIKGAADAGTPVFLHNAGFNDWQELGALGYVGEDPYQMGHVGGAISAAKGVKSAICFIHVPGNPALEQRCDGYRAAVEKAGGEARVVSLSITDSQNPQANLQALKGAIQANSNLSDIFTLGASQAMAAVQAVQETGRVDSIAVGSTDLSSAMLAAVRDGKLAFILDQQPYLQGYYSVLAATQYSRYGIRPTGPISTGPLVITVDNVDAVLEIDAKYGGVRGAQ